jgi:hypothetical protein
VVAPTWIHFGAVLVNRAGALRFRLSEKAHRFDAVGMSEVKPIIEARSQVPTSLPVESRAAEIRMVDA